MDLILDELRADDWDQVRQIYLDGLASGQASFEVEGIIIGTAGSSPAGMAESSPGRRWRPSQLANVTPGWPRSVYMWPPISGAGEWANVCSKP